MYFADASPQQTGHANPIVYPQYTIQNINVHCSVLNGALCDMGRKHCGISEFGLLLNSVLDRTEELYSQQQMI